jgi:hypothetical protein
MDLPFPQCFSCHGITEAICVLTGCLYCPGRGVAEADTGMAGREF